jgi:protein-disulfide isomerase
MQQKQIAEMKKQEEEQMKNPLKPVLSDQRILIGNKAGTVEIVEYADFQCPACRMAYESLKPIKEKYKDKIKFYYKNMPLSMHRMAYPAATYYESVAKQSMPMAHKYYQLLFENQNKLTDDAFLKASAKSVGADTKKLAADIKSESVQKLIESDMNEFEKFGFTGTPVVLINGVAMYGAQTPEEYERVIERTLSAKN